MTRHLSLGLLQVEAIAIRKFGSLEELDAERRLRLDKRLNVRMVKRRHDSQANRAETAQEVMQAKVRQRLHDEYGGHADAASGRQAAPAAGPAASHHEAAGEHFQCHVEAPCPWHVAL